MTRWGDEAATAAHFEKAEALASAPKCFCGHRFGIHEVFPPHACLGDNGVTKCGCPRFKRLAAAATDPVR